MDRVATKIAKKIGVLFQNDYGHTSSREQVAGHDACWSTACDHTARLQFFSHASSIEYHPNWDESKHPGECARSRCVYLQRGGRLLRCIATQLLGLFRTSDDRTGFTPDWFASARCLLWGRSVRASSRSGSGQTGAVIGVDLAKALLESARTKAIQRRLGNIEFE